MCVVGSHRSGGRCCSRSCESFRFKHIDQGKAVNTMLAVELIITCDSEGRQEQYRCVGVEGRLHAPCCTCLAFL